MPLNFHIQVKFQFYLYVENSFCNEVKSLDNAANFLRDCGDAFYPEIVKNAISLCQLKIEFCDALCKRRESSRLFCSPMAARIAAP